VARNLSPARTEFYRALVEVFREGEWQVQTAFGPYTDKGKCVDGSKHFGFTKAMYENGTRRCRRQKQHVDRHSGEIVWRDVEFDDL